MFACGADGEEDLPWLTPPCRSTGCHCLPAAGGCAKADRVYQVEGAEIPAFCCAVEVGAFGPAARFATGRCDVEFLALLKRAVRVLLLPAFARNGVDAEEDIGQRADDRESGGEKDPEQRGLRASRGLRRRCRQTAVESAKCSSVPIPMDSGRLTFSAAMKNIQLLLPI